MTDVTTAAVPADELDRVLAAGSLRSDFQPIVDLESGAVVAFEALVRGPEGPLARPDQLFATARAHDRLAALDAASPRSPPRPTTACSTPCCSSSTSSPRCSTPRPWTTCWR